MRLKPIAFLLTLFLCGCSSKQATRSPAQTPVASETVQASEPDLFQETVRPMLARNCAPCHIPGGKMYARLPFDQEQIVKGNKNSILRRLKSTEDQAVLERWVASLPSAETAKTTEEKK